MNGKLPVAAVLGLFCGSGTWPQNVPAHRENVPIYHVTVIERTVKAVDYQYRQLPTRVDFKGTVLLPQAKGQAAVESKRGRTEIEAKFERVEAPERFGHEYLTYVLWAITPDGHPKNLGEVVAGGSDHAHLHVTTDLQAFGMIVTAEPYSAVRQPSDVVVMENEIRPDTIGATELIQPKYELLPRGSNSYFGWISSVAPMVSGRISFSITTTSLGCRTAEYGSAVTIIPNACKSVVTCRWAWSDPPATTSPRFFGCPSGVIAQST